MSAINIATDVPTRINTVEKLHCWTSDLLHLLNPDVTIEEARGVLERAAQVTPFYASSIDPATWLVTNRHTFKLAAAWNSPGQDRFMHAQELSQALIPTEWKT